MAESADAIGTVFTVGDRPIRKGGDWYYFLLQRCTKKDFFVKVPFFAPPGFFLSPLEQISRISGFEKKEEVPNYFCFSHYRRWGKAYFLEEEKLSVSKRLNLPLRNANFSAVFANICAWQKTFFRLLKNPPFATSDFLVFVSTSNKNHRRLLFARREEIKKVLQFPLSAQIWSGPLFSFVYNKTIFLLLPQTCQIWERHSFPRDNSNGRGGSKRYFESWHKENTSAERIWILEIPFPLPPPFRSRVSIIERNKKK